MRSFLLLLLLFAIFSLSAQADRHERYAYQRFGQASPGDTLFALGDMVNVRATPDAAAGITGTLSIGTRVIVDSVVEAGYTQRGFTAPWYRVSYALAGKKASGFVWSGMLTHIFLQSPSVKGLSFLMGAAGFVPDIEDPYFGKFSVQVRVVRNGAEVAQVVFEALGLPGHIYAGLTLGDQGVAGTKELLLLSSSGEACGVPGGEILVIWDGKTLFKAGEANCMSDVPVFHEENWVFPGEPKGKKGFIVWNMKQGEYIEDENGEYQERVEAQSEKRFGWNGTKLVKK